ncbi:MAG: hypothetical protein LUE61_04790 [Clostridiales bacterium]|nr:hypothetical protein [Clostridiales bacterium]
MSDESIPRPELEVADVSKLISEFFRKEKEGAQNVFIRKYWFFDSVSDIATRYSFSESRVKNMLYHTRNKLSAYLKKTMSIFLLDESGEVIVEDGK